MSCSLSPFETAMANRADLLSTFMQPHSSMSYNTTVARNLKGNSARLVCNLRSAWALGSQAEDQEKGNKERGKPSTEHRHVVHSAMLVSQNKILLGPAAKAKTPHSAVSKLEQAAWFCPEMTAAPLASQLGSTVPRRIPRSSTYSPFLLLPQRSHKPLKCEVPSASTTFHDSVICHQESFLIYGWRKQNTRNKFSNAIPKLSFKI